MSLMFLLSISILINCRVIWLLWFVFIIHLNCGAGCEVGRTKSDK